MLVCLWIQEIMSLCSKALWDTESKSVSHGAHDMQLRSCEILIDIVCKVNGPVECHICQFSF